MIDFIDLINQGFKYQSKYAKKLPYSPISLSALDAEDPLHKRQDARKFRHAKIIEVIGHMMEEIQEVRQHIPRRSWRKDEPSFLDSVKNRKEYIRELADVLIFFIAILVWSGISGREFVEVFLEKSKENTVRSDHVISPDANGKS